jgi:2'-5' RNA ligase
MRIFVGTFPAKSLAEEIDQYCTPLLDEHGDLLRPIRSENRHLTWIFLGEVGEAVVEIAKSVLDDRLSGAVEAPPVPVRFERPTAFPTFRRPRVLVLPLTDGTGRLKRLRDNLAERFLAAGVPFDRKMFRPHVTLAYVRRGRRPTRSFIEALTVNPPPAIDEWWIDSVDLIESRLKPSGSQYVSLAHHALRSQHGRPFTS